jgi:hypothetical protein
MDPLPSIQRRHIAITETSQMRYKTVFIGETKPILNMLSFFKEATIITCYA